MTTTATALSESRLRDLAGTNIGLPLDGLTEFITAAATTRRLGDVETLSHLDALIEELRTHLRSTGYTHLTDATPDSLDAWCRAKVDTAHERRAALFAAVGVARSFWPKGIWAKELRLPLGPLSTPLDPRPLLPLEQAAVRSGAYYGQRNGFRRRFLGLAECGGSAQEIPIIAARDVNLGHARINFPGTGRICARTLPLTDWGKLQLLPGLLDRDPDDTLGYSANRGGDLRAAANTVSANGTRMVREAGMVDGDVTFESLRRTCACSASTDGRVTPVMDVLGLAGPAGAAAAMELLALAKSLRPTRPESTVRR